MEDRRHCRRRSLCCGVGSPPLWTCPVTRPAAAAMGASPWSNLEAVLGDVEVDPCGDPLDGAGENPAPPL